MKTRVRPCCSQETFANEGEASRKLERIKALGVSRVDPIGVRKCRNGWHLDFGKPTSSLAPVSKKRQREATERRAMVETLWPGMEPECVVLGCPRLADDVHEPLSRGRGGSITDPDNAVPICRGHHDDVTFGEPAWAYEQGLLIHSWDSGTVPAVAEKRRRMQGEVAS